MKIKPDRRKNKLTKVTKELLDKVLKDIKKGAPKKYAAEANGLSESHFYEMIQQGISDMQYGNKDTLYYYLAVSLRKIERDDVIFLNGLIVENQKGHVGAQWRLEHAYWRLYGNNAQLKELSHEISLLKGDAIEVRNRSRCEKDD